MLPHSSGTKRSWWGVSCQIIRAFSPTCLQREHHTTQLVRLKMIVNCLCVLSIWTTVKLGCAQVQRGFKLARKASICREKVDLNCHNPLGFFYTWWCSCPCPSLFVVLLPWKFSERDLNSVNQKSSIVFDLAGHIGQTQLTNSAKSANLKASLSISPTDSHLGIGKSHTGGAVQAALTCLLFLFPLQNALELTSILAPPVLSCVSLNQCNFWTVPGAFLLPSFLSLPSMEARGRASSYALPEQSRTTKHKWTQTILLIFL